MRFEKTLPPVPSSDKIVCSLSALHLPEHLYSNKAISAIPDIDFGNTSKGEIKVSKNMEGFRNLSKYGINDKKILNRCNIVPLKDNE